MIQDKIVLGITPIVGTRWWTVREDFLYGLGLFPLYLKGSGQYPGPKWSPGKPLRAACLTYQGSIRTSKFFTSRHKGFDAPQLNCTCGIYATKSVTLRPPYTTRYGIPESSFVPVIQGEVLLWGSLIEHGEGWRAQYAQVKAFHEELSCIERDLLYKMANLYRVPVLRISEDHYMTPLGDRLLVKPDAQRDVRKGSIYIPEVARSKPQEGEIVAAGSEVKWLKVGDRVLFGKYAGSEVQIDEQPYLLVREVDVMVRL